MFFAACSEAGPDACALHESSADAVKARASNIFAGLKDRPLPVRAQTNAVGASTEYGLVDYAFTRGIVFQWLYHPYGAGRNASAVAGALAAAERGDGRPLWDMAKGALVDNKCECGDKRRAPAGREYERTLAIACSDGDVVDDSLGELREHFERMAQDSSFAESWSLRLICSCVSFDG
jgi:hypothetical protein